MGYFNGFLKGRGIHFVNVGEKEDFRNAGRANCIREGSAIALQRLSPSFKHNKKQLQHLCVCWK